MIRYALGCDREHAFEAWFASSAAYDRAAAAGQNRCPVCGSRKVEKAIMAPAIAGKGARSAPPAAPQGERSASQPVPPEQMTLATADPRREAFFKAVREFRQKVTENADYVGPRFPEEARKVHYGEVEPKSIYGEATPDEARDLAEEGVAFQPLPPLPEKQN
jgi:hypothetical protein